MSRKRAFPPRQTGRAIVFGVCCLVGLAAPAGAEDAAEKGRAIAEETDRRDRGWGDAYTELEMVLANRAGETSTRKLRISTLEVLEAGRGDLSLTVFDNPRDIKGTAFLSHTRILEADDQWLYLPALKRVKRISSANKSGPFVGSEFAYEDLLSQEVDKYTYTWLRDEPCGPLACFVVERMPLYPHSGYARQVAWIDAEAYRPMRIDFYDRKDSLLKTLAFSDYRQYLGRYWRAHVQVMENHQSGKSTTLEFLRVEFRVGVNRNDFQPQRLNRAR